MFYRQWDKSFLYLELESFQIIFKKVTLTGVLFYTFMLILSTFYAGYYVFETVDEYLNSPMNTEFNVVTVSQMTLPQVYVCSPVKVTKSFYDQNPDLYWKAEILKAVYFGKSYDLDIHKDNLTFILDMTAEDMHDLYKNMTLSLDRFWVFMRLKQIVSSNINPEKVSTKVFDPQHGVCYILDVGPEYQQVLPAEALTFIVDMNSASHPGLESEAVPEFLGVKISVAEKIDPTTSDTEELLIPIYARTTIELRESRIIYEDIDEEEDDQLILLNATFSGKACRLDCRLWAIWNACQCLLPYDRFFYKNSSLNFCTPRQMINCARSSSRKLEIESSIKQCTHGKCARHYDRKKYDCFTSVLELSNLYPHWEEGENSSDWIYIFVAHEKLQYEEFRNSWSMQLHEMISNVGGQIGLWLGFSMCTIFQIPIVLITYLCLKVKNQLKK